MKRFELKEKDGRFEATNVRGIRLKARYITCDDTWAIATLETKSGYYIFEAMRNSLEEAVSVMEDYFNDNEKKIRERMAQVGA